MGRSKRNGNRRKKSNPIPSNKTPPNEIINFQNNGYGYGKSGASRTNTSMVGWNTVSGGPDRDIVDNIPLLRERSRDSFMSNPISTGALKKYKTSVVGRGLVPKPNLRYKQLGISQEEALKIEQEIKTKFNLWAKSLNADSMRMHNFYVLQGLVLLSWLMNGDVFVLPKFKKRAGVDTKLCIQVIEGDRVRSPYINFNTNVLEGVEIDGDGEVIAYHIANRHPGDGVGYESQRIKSFNKLGKKNILHIFEPERPGQRRGAPILAPVLESLKQIGRYSQAELMAAVVNAMYAFFIEQTVDTPQDGPIGGMFQNSGPAKAYREGTNSFEVKNGGINVLNPGEKVQNFTPGRPNSNYKLFVDSIYEEIGAAVELPKEVLMNNFQSSYSASRAALEEAWKKFHSIRGILIDYFCQPIYEAFILEQISLGELNLPGYFDSEIMRKEYSRATWVGSKKTSLDPYKEMRARELALKMGLTNREILAQEDGLDFDEIIEQKLREDKLLGISPNMPPNDLDEELEDELKEGKSEKKS